MNNEVKDKVEEELEKSTIKRKKTKKDGIFLMGISYVVIPILVSMIIISMHSKKLITDNILDISYIILVAALILFVFGLGMFLCNIKIKTEKKVHKFFKYLYIFSMTIYTVFCATILIMLYGPIDSFKEMIITNSKNGSTEDKICRWLYSEEEINEYLPKEKEDEEENKEEKEPEEPKKVEYANEYEKAVLTKNEGNEDYKYIPVKVGGYDAHLVVIYDPSKIHLITSKAFNTGSGMETIQSMCKRNKGKVCINGGRFKDTTGWGSDIPKGVLIKDSKIIWKDNSGKREIIGFTKDNKLLLTKATAEEAVAQGIRDGLEFGPFLMVNGKATTFNSASGGYERAARVAMAQRKDGIVLFLVTEGKHTKGPNLVEVIDLLKLYGAYNIANLDGGASSQLVIENKLINKPLNVYGELVKGGRKVVSGFGLLN